MLVLVRSPPPLVGQNEREKEGGRERQEKRKERKGSQSPPRKSPLQKTFHRRNPFKNKTPKPRKTTNNGPST